MATIVDVARKAGASVSTVSHVLKGTRRVAPNTARAMEAAIASLGYRPNMMTRSLKAGSTRAVGIAISSISNPYFSDIICAIETECARLGMAVFLSDIEGDPSRELEVVMALHEQPVDGIILDPSPDPERRALSYLRDAGLPCVLVDRMPDPAFDQVGVNNHEAMRELVAQVAKFGHRRIGYIGGNPGFETTRQRMVGYGDELAGTGVIDVDLLVTGSATTMSAMQAADRPLDLDRPPTALDCGNNLVTIGITKAIHKRGWRVAKDVSVGGFDDLEWVDYFVPRLTPGRATLRRDRLARRLSAHERITAPEGSRRTIRLDAAIVERESCGRPK